MDAWFIALLGFAIAASITPGPNNVLVMANAARHGVRATMPQMLGISVGFSLMIVLVGSGIAAILVAMPIAAQVMRWVAMAWLLYLAWQIASAGPLNSTGEGRIFGFVDAVLFQWVNPKPWLLALSIASAWVQPTSPSMPQLLLIGATFGAVGPACNLPWALLGSGAARFITNPRRLRAFNIAMALLLVVSMLPLIGNQP